MLDFQEFAISHLWFVMTDEPLPPLNLKVVDINKDEATWQRTEMDNNKEAHVNVKDI